MSFEVGGKVNGNRACLSRLLLSLLRPDSARRTGANPSSRVMDLASERVAIPRRIATPAEANRRTPWGTAMAFEREWAQHKVNAEARQSTGMHLNQLPADQGSHGSSGEPGGDGVLSAHPTSINNSSHQLIEIAGFLYEGRPDNDLCTMARQPRSPAEVADRVGVFARFADNQYRDAISLFAALSTKLKKVGGDFVNVESDVAKRFLNSILQGDYVSPEAR
jgi:hypothetical protein